MLIWLRGVQQCHAQLCDSCTSLHSAHCCTCAQWQTKNLNFLVGRCTPANIFKKGWYANYIGVSITSDNRDVVMIMSHGKGSHGSSQHAAGLLLAQSTILTEFQKSIGSKPISARNTAENKAFFCFWGGFIFGIVFFLQWIPTGTEGGLNLGLIRPSVLSDFLDFILNVSSFNFIVIMRFCIKLFTEAPPAWLGTVQTKNASKNFNKQEGCPMRYKWSFT